MVVLSLYWDDHTCVESEVNKWRLYAVVAALRMFLYLLAVTLLYHLNGRISAETRLMVSKEGKVGWRLELSGSRWHWSCSMMITREGQDLALD